MLIIITDFQLTRIPHNYKAKKDQGFYATMRMENTSEGERLITKVAP